MGFFSRLFGGSKKQAIQEMLAEGAYLVDVRTAGEFKSDKVKGSVNIPLSQIQYKTKQLKGKKNIIVFCKSGARSGRAKRILNQQGFDNVVNGGSVWRIRSIESLRTRKNNQ